MAARLTLFVNIILAIVLVNVFGQEMMPSASDDRVKRHGESLLEELIEQIVHPHHHHHHHHHESGHYPYNNGGYYNGYYPGGGYYQNGYYPNYYNYRRG